MLEFNLKDGYSLRIMQEADLPRLMELIHSFKTETPYADTNFDEENMLKILKNTMVIVLSHYSSIEGFLMASITSNPFFPQWKIAHEHIWYVSPAHRGKFSMSLVDAFEAWAKLNECTHTCLSHMSTLDLSSVYEKAGYKLLEQSYVKDIR